MYLIIKYLYIIVIIIFYIFRIPLLIKAQAIYLCSIKSDFNCNLSSLFKI